MNYEQVDDEALIIAWYDNLQAWKNNANTTLDSRLWLEIAFRGYVLNTPIVVEALDKHARHLFDKWIMSASYPTPKKVSSPNSDADAPSNLRLFNNLCRLLDNIEHDAWDETTNDPKPNTHAGLRLSIFRSVAGNIIASFQKRYNAENASIPERREAFLRDYKLPGFFAFCMKCVRSQLYDRLRNHTPIPIIRRDGEDQLSPEEQADREKIFQSVRKVIASLKPQHQQLIYLRYVEGLKPKQIAEVVGNNVEDVSSSLHYILKKLRPNPELRGAANLLGLTSDDDAENSAYDKSTDFRDIS